MANNPVVNTLTFTGSVAGQATIQAQGIAGGLTFLLPNTAPIQGQLLDVQAVNGNNVFLGWVSPSSSSISLSQILQSGATSGQVIEWNGSAWVPSSSVPGSGTVTSVALTAPAEFTVGGSPITGAGTLAITKATQLQNLVWASPNGSTGVPVFRALVAADIPALSALSGSLAVAQINSKVGNGNAVQLSTTGQTIVAGDVLTYDANGNVQDSGTLLSSLATSASVALKAPLASPTFTGLVTLPVAASTTGLTMLSDNNQVSSTNAPIVLSSATATNPQTITITPNSFFGPMMQFSGQNTPYTTPRLVEVGAQGLYLSNAGFAINGQLGTSGQVLTTLGAAGDGGPAGLAWHTLVVGDVSGAAPLASPTFTGTVVLPSAVNATGGSDLIFTNTGANKIRIATATGIFDFFGTGGGMTLGSQNSQVAIDASGNISLSATGGSNLSVNSAGGLVTSSDFKPTNLFSFPGNTSGTAGQLFSSLGSDTGTAWVDPIMRKATVTLAGTDIQNLNTTPIQILPALGAGLVYNIVSTFWQYTFATTPFTVTPNDSTGFLFVAPTGDASAGYSSSVILGTTTATLNLAASATQSAMGGSSYGGNGTDNSTKALVVGVTAATISGAGDGTLKVVVYYTIETA